MSLPRRETWKEFRNATYMSKRQVPCLSTKKIARAIEPGSAPPGPPLELSRGRFVERFALSSLPTHCSTFDESDNKWAVAPWGHVDRNWLTRIWTSDFGFTSATISGFPPHIQ